MDDLEKRSLIFAKNFDKGYKQVKIGAVLKQARLKAGPTPEEVTDLLNTKKSAIPRIENHAEDIRLSMLVNHAQAAGKNIQFQAA